MVKYSKALRKKAGSCEQEAGKKKKKNTGTNSGGPQTVNSGATSSRDGRLAAETEH